MNCSWWTSWEVSWRQAFCVPPTITPDSLLGTKGVQLLNLNCLCRLFFYPFLRNWCHTTGQNNILSLQNQQDSISSQRHISTIWLESSIMWWDQDSPCSRTHRSAYFAGDWAQGIPSIAVCSWVSQKWPNVATEAQSSVIPEGAHPTPRGTGVALTVARQSCHMSVSHFYSFHRV